MTLTSEGQTERSADTAWVSSTGEILLHEVLAVIEQSRLRGSEATAACLALATRWSGASRARCSWMTPACYPGRVSEYVGDGDDPAHDLTKAEKDALEAQLRKEIVAHIAARERREASKKKRRSVEVSVSKSRRGHQGREH